MLLKVEINSFNDSLEFVKYIEKLFMELKGIDECGMLKIGEHEIPLRFCNDMILNCSSPQVKLLTFELQSIRK